MGLINAVLIDDEKNVREALYEIIAKYCDNIKIIGMANSAEQGMELIKDTNPDLVFLDVQMPNVSGFEMLGQIGQIDFDVIFVTSYDKYALKAIKYCALDYLLKPINIAELQMAISKYDKGNRKHVSIMMENLRNPADAQKIVIRHSKGIRYASDDEIIRCESDGNYSKVYFTDDTKLLVSKTLKEFEELLPESTFHRVHQSHIINVAYVKSYLSGRGGKLEMNNGDLIDVARSRKKEILGRLNTVES